MADAPFVEEVEIGRTDFFSMEILRRSRNCWFCSRNRSHSAKASLSLCSMDISCTQAKCRNLNRHAMPNILNWVDSSLPLAVAASAFVLLSPFLPFLFLAEFLREILKAQSLGPSSTVKMFSVLATTFS
jgi:hypothetical protein